MWLSFVTTAFFAFFLFCRAAPAWDADLEVEWESEANSLLIRQASTEYAPVDSRCPRGALVRPATKINPQEARYVTQRKVKADEALAQWLKKRGRFSTSSLPVVGYTSSGGGYRSLLESAGVTQGLDIRDSSVGTSGVYQSLSYQAGLSGGSWFLSSLAGNNWPTVTALKDGLWEEAFDNSFLVPANLLSTDGVTQYTEVSTDIAAKGAAGYELTVVDPWGRLLSYQLLDTEDGGAGVRLSGLTRLSNFTERNVPYPIITATTNFPDDNQCFPSFDGPLFEFSPYDYGSWDQGVSAFAQTKFMGTDITNRKATNAGECTQNYDNIGYIFGTSSDVFVGACQVIQPSNNTANLPGVLEGIIAQYEDPSVNDLFGVYPNPFYKYARSPLVSDDRLLYLADGGLTLQNNPIWPFLQEQRKVDVLIVNDNSADTDDNFPNGTEIRQTYDRAQAVGLSKMPFIPDVDTFVAQGLNKRATFFGCDQPDTMFIVFLPNVNYTYPSNQPTSKLQYSVKETNGMIANGVDIATQNGEKGWPFCLACAIKHADAGALPKRCDACFKKYCYSQ